MRFALLVYENTLFAELIAEALAQSHVPFEVRAVKPDAAQRLIAALRPEMIVLDETIADAECAALLSAARQLPTAEVVLLHPQHNTLVHLTIRRSPLTSLEDVGKALSMTLSTNTPPLVRPEAQDRRDHALAQASVYGFLAAIFNRCPDITFVQHLRELSGDSIRLSCEAGDLSPDAIEGMALMARFIDEAAALPADEVQEALALDWTRLFRGVQRGYGPEPPYANLHLRGRQDESRTLHDIIHTYAAHNARPASASANRPDYLGVMLDFMRFLFTREADAWGRDDPAQADAFFEAACQFREAHLGQWARQFCADALAYAETEFYRGGLQITKGFMTDALNHT